MAGQKILVAYDGSGQSDKALEWAIDLAKQMPAEILLVSVCNLPLHHFEEAPTYVERYNTTYRQNIATMLEKKKAGCTSPGLTINIRVREGHPVDEIIRCAQEEKADLIIVGNRGLGGFGQLLLGSVAHKLVTYSPIPVIVIK
ncbi:MAG TPA: universal stress protein [Patescibacteria group bacterium]|nr:universal stress protein [Patescibacteria group bacterium]